VHAHEQRHCDDTFSAWPVLACTLLELFWRIRRGSAKDTKGTAFVVYEDIFDAKTACEHLSGFNVAGRYLVVLYYQQSKAFAKQVRAADQSRDHLRLAVRASEELRAFYSVLFWFVLVPLDHQGVRNGVC
jgi:hypothetical protein